MEDALQQHDERPLLLILVSWFGLFLSFLCSVVALPFTLWVWLTQPLVLHKALVNAPIDVVTYLLLAMPRYVSATAAPAIFALTLFAMFDVGYAPLVNNGASSGLAWFIGIVLGLSGIGVVLWGVSNTVRVPVVSLHPRRCLV